MCVLKECMCVYFFDWHSKIKECLERGAKSIDSGDVIVGYVTQEVGVLGCQVWDTKTKTWVEDFQLSTGLWVTNNNQ